MKRYFFITSTVLAVGLFYIVPTISASDDLVGYWKLDETMSDGVSSVIDSSGGDRHGTPSGATGANDKPQPSSDVPDVSFTNPRSLDFDGTDDVVATTYSPVYSDGDSFTWSLWFKTGTNQSGKGIFSARDSSKPGTPLAEIYLVSGEIQGLFRGADGARKDLNYTVSYADSEWHNISIVIDQGNGTLYYDGVARDTITGLDMDINLGDVSLPIGASNYENSLQRYFQGKIDDVRVYSRALTPGEISELSGVFPISENFDEAKPVKWILGSSASWGAVVDSEETLRLTTAATSQAGLGYYDTAFSSDNGIVVEFDYYSGGGTGADGLAFFLVDGDLVNVGNIAAGAFGSSLGYALSGSTPGVPHAYLGVGFDEYGGFPVAGGGKTGIGSSAPDNVTLRGSGNGTSGYNYLTHTRVSDSPISQTIDGGWRRARISISPNDSGAVIRVEMSWDDGATWHTVIDDYAYDDVPPDFFKLGFTAGTGGSTNIHAIDNLQVSLPTDIAVSVTDAPDGTYRYGDTLEYTYTVTNNGPNDAGEVTVTNDMVIGHTGFTDVIWSYTSTGADSGSGDESDIDSFVVSLDDGEVATVTVEATVGSAVNASTTLSHSINAVPADGYIDPSPSSAEATVAVTTGQTWDDSLVAYWRFDEGSGSTALDSTVNRKNGTISGASYSTTTPPDVEFTDSHSLNFDGVNDGITTSLSLNNYPEFTLAGWAYPRSAADNEGWFGANNVFEFFFTTDNQLRCWTPHGEVNWTYDPETFFNVWHHITCLGDGENVILYVDGDQVGISSDSPTDNYGTGDNFSIGIGVQDGGSSGPFDGYIDDVRVYNRALTPGEMFSLGTGSEEPEEDADDPIVSEVVASSISDSGATISWTTDENASSKVSYGLTNLYGTTTAEINTSPRVTEHVVNLSGLLSCTMYHYAVVSTDGASNTATSTDSTFTTTGCTGNATPTTATSTTIYAGNTGTTNVTENAKTFSVTADAPVDSTIVIQVKAVPNTAVLTALGRPSSAPNEIGATVFDVKAIVNGDTIFDSFDTEVTIDYEYTEDEVSGIDESTLWLYHYTGGQWIALNDCVLDTDANSISCTTPSFSIFGLFGTSPETEEPTGSRTTGGTHFGCKDTNASNYEYFSAHKQELCKYDSPEQALQKIVDQHRDLLIRAHEAGIVLPQNILIMLGVENGSLSVRDLEYGMDGEDVRRLQTLLIGQGYSIPAGATGYFGTQTQYALDAYQVANGIAPRGGYFGPITRAQMKEAGLSGLWW